MGKRYGGYVQIADMSGNQHLHIEVKVKDVLYVDEKNQKREDHCFF